MLSGANTYTAFSTSPRVVAGGLFCPVLPRGEQAPARARLSRRERPVAPSSEKGTLGFWLFYCSKWGQLSAFLGWLSQGRIREPGAALGERQLRTCCSAPGDCKHGTTGGIGE